MVTAVYAILRGFDAKQPFKADAQALAHLPDQVGAGVLARVVKRGDLPGSIVEVHVPVGDG